MDRYQIPKPTCVVFKTRTRSYKDPEIAEWFSPETAMEFQMCARTPVPTILVFRVLNGRYGLVWDTNLPNKRTQTATKRRYLEKFTAWWRLVRNCASASFSIHHQKIAWKDQGPVPNSWFWWFIANPWRYLNDLFKFTTSAIRNNWTTHTFAYFEKSPETLARRDLSRCKCIALMKLK